MQKRKNISMQEIQDYVENLLSPNHKAEIDNFLAENPEDKEALLGYQKYISLGGTRKMWDRKMEISETALFSYVEEDIRIYWANQWGKAAENLKKSVQVAAACCLFAIGGVWAWQVNMQTETYLPTYSNSISLLEEAQYPHDTMPAHCCPLVGNNGARISQNSNKNTSKNENTSPKNDPEINNTPKINNTSVVQSNLNSTPNPEKPQPIYDDNTKLAVTRPAPEPPKKDTLKPDPIGTQPESPSPANGQKK